MVPLPLAVKAGKRRGGSGKTDYRNLWWVGSFVHISYFTGAVRNEKTSCKGVGSLRESVRFSFVTDGFFVFDLLRLLIASLLNTVFSVPVKRGGLYHTQSDYKGKRRGM
jgi:hypothetical protein